MPTLVWDNPEDRVYEAGLDRGVLYLPDGTGVVWNGLIDVIEKFDRSTSPVYFDGMKIQDLVTLGDFSASLKAVTYPDEFVELEGAASYRQGVFFQDQRPQVFGLCYRTGIGDDVSGTTDAYRLHILWNVTAIPHEKTYASDSNAPSMIEFEWDIVAVPEETPGFRPTAHMVIDSREVDPLLLSDLEGILYGSSLSEATLLPMTSLISFMQSWFRIRVTDNGDGTFTIETHDALDVITWTDDPTDTLFQLTEANVVYHTDDETLYDLSDTLDISDVALVKIEYYPDGSWSATSDNDAIIPMQVNGEFQIVDANAIFLDADTYRIADTDPGE